MHAALIVPREKIPAGTWPAHIAAGQEKYLEVGWGDYEGYRLDWTSRIVFRAMFLPTRSTLFVRGFNSPVIQEFEGRAEEIIQVEISDEGFARMCDYFHSHYRLDAHGRPVYLGNDFYAGEGSYHMFHNSNHWAASALRRAGCPITPFWAITVQNVMFQTRRFGEVVWRR